MGGEYDNPYGIDKESRFDAALGDGVGRKFDYDTAATGCRTGKNTEKVVPCSELLST
jgi:hypothetical protein